MATPEQRSALLAIPDQCLGMRDVHVDQFLWKVDYSGDCWVWTGPASRRGYGIFSWYILGSGAGRGNRSIQAHRLSLLLTDRPPTRQQVVDHLCRNTLCVNPLHLEAVTHRENILRGVGPAAVQARRTTCPRNHPYDYTGPDRRRRCTTCDRARDLATPGRR